MNFITKCMCMKKQQLSKLNCFIIQNTNNLGKCLLHNIKRIDDTEISTSLAIVNGGSN